MVRKVGFGDDKDDAPTSTPKKSIADQAMDRFRQRSKIEKAREAEIAAESRGKAGRILFLILWLILWVGMSGTILFSMASDGLNANIIPLVVLTAASVLVTTKVVKSIINAVKGSPRPNNRPDNF